MSNLVVARFFAIPCGRNIQSRASRVHGNPSMSATRCTVQPRFALSSPRSSLQRSVNAVWWPLFQTSTAAFVLFGGAPATALLVAAHPCRKRTATAGDPATHSGLDAAHRGLVKFYVTFPTASTFVGSRRRSAALFFALLAFFPP